ncbi:hypothetical protein [Roseateles cavernae]|uniref:hypothetical protein n=1 Tax=Roseateles cavernae TaxID=3153578 RepID=UPI0032E3823B
MDGALPLPPAARLVRRARLAPARAGGGPALRWALEDALRTAEFHDCGRLLLVRRLRLHGLPPQASPAQLARALEQAWRELAAQALPASHPQAGAAPAVFFNSRFDARLAWLRRLADCGGAPGQAAGAAGEWYWRAALPELAALPATAAASSAPVLRVLLQEQEAALVQALRRWTDAALLRLDSQLPPALAERLLSAVDRAQTAAADRIETQDGSARLGPMMVPASSRCWPPWLQRLRQPGPGTLCSASDRAGGIAAPLSAQEREAQRPEPPAMKTDGTTPRRLSTPPLHPAPTAPDARRRQGAGLPWLAEASFSARGGLLLLLNLLQTLGYERQARAVPGCVDALFLSLLGACEPDGQRDAQRALFEACHAGSHPQLTRLWTLRLRRALRGHARMDLAELLQRPAWVGTSPTHIDVVYALDSVDLRLRRLGLDSDPGWLPWFGRIVAFHFLGTELLPPEPGHG